MMHHLNTYLHSEKSDQAPLSRMCQISRMLISRYIQLFTIIELNISSRKIHLNVSNQATLRVKPSAGCDGLVAHKSGYPIIICNSFCIFFNYVKYIYPGPHNEMWYVGFQFLNVLSILFIMTISQIYFVTRVDQELLRGSVTNYSA